jgi:hypothetical protein
MRDPNSRLRDCFAETCDFDLELTLILARAGERRGAIICVRLNT